MNKKNLNFLFFLIFLNFKSTKTQQNTTIEANTPKQVLELFELNYKKAKNDKNFNLYYFYFRDRLINRTISIEMEEYKGYDYFFTNLDRASQLYYKRNHLENYTIAFPNEDYYLWRIMVSFVLKIIYIKHRLIHVKNLIAIVVRI